MDKGVIIDVVPAVSPAYAGLFPLKVIGLLEVSVTVPAVVPAATEPRSEFNIPAP